jgi:23S rRNA (guanine745-N1)-methyltransferase
MQRARASDFRCPLCKGTFLAAATPELSWRCPTGHSFDVSKDGDVHLIPAGHGSALVGDSAEMLRARRAFFARGHYRPLSDAIAAAAVSAIRDDAIDSANDVVIADVGCGEGSHFAVTVAAFDAAGIVGRAAATDIEKKAVKMVAKAHRGVRAVTADASAQLPFADAAVDVITVAFAPRGTAVELARVIKPGGAVVVAFPEVGHLAEVVDRFGGIGIAADKRARIEGDLAVAFDVGAADSDVVVDVALDLDAASLAELIAMTPHARHVAAAVDQVVTGGFQTRLRARVLTAHRR